MQLFKIYVYLLLLICLYIDVYIFVILCTFLSIHESYTSVHVINSYQCSTSPVMRNLHKSLPFRRERQQRQETSAAVNTNE